MVNWALSGMVGKQASIIVLTLQAIPGAQIQAARDSGTGGAQMVRGGDRWREHVSGMAATGNDASATTDSVVAAATVSAADAVGRSTASTRVRAGN